MRKCALGMACHSTRYRAVEMTESAHSVQSLAIMKVQNPRHKMQLALLAEPKTPLESACLYYIILYEH